MSNDLLILEVIPDYSEAIIALQQPNIAEGETEPDYINMDEVCLTREQCKELFALLKNKLLWGKDNELE
jgi:hypothetical protein